MKRFLCVLFLFCTLTAIELNIQTKQFGTNYAGFCYPSDLKHLNSESVVYCFGAGEDISHDLELAHQLNSKVYIFDPTPRAIKHVGLVKDVLNGVKSPIANKRYGGGDPLYWDRIISNKIPTEKIRFLSYGLYTKNAKLKFYKPQNPNFVSHSLVQGMKSKKYINVPVKNLETIMKELQHDKIDLMKIDIEGVECDVIDYMLDKNILPIYLSVDFDLGWSGLCDRKRCDRVINRLKHFGYVVLNSKGQDYSFVRKEYL